MTTAERIAQLIDSIQAYAKAEAACPDQHGMLAGIEAEIRRLAEHPAVHLTSAQANEWLTSDREGASLSPAGPECGHRHITSHGRGWECCACGVGIVSLALPIAIPLFANQQAAPQGDKHEG